MTELPTLQAALREAAERTYPRRRRPLIPALVVAAAAAAALLVIRDREGNQPSEVAATPTATQPAPTVAFTPTPTPARLRSREIPKLSSKELTPTPVAPDDPALREATSLMNPAHVVVKAWYVPGLKGHVLLTRNGDEWCFSAPDPLTDQPDVERGVGCAPAARHEKHGDYIGIGNVIVTLAPGADTPEIRQR
jgi:hypothetical protein